MKNASKIFVMFLSLTTILFGCSKSPESMTEMEEQLIEFISEMENGFIFTVNYLESNTSIEVHVKNEDEYYVAFAGGELHHTELSCGINGENKIEVEGTVVAATEADLALYCEQAFLEYEEIFNYAFVDGYFSSEFDVKYSDEGDHFLAEGIYETVDLDYHFILYKDNSMMTFEDDFTSVTMTIAEIDFEDSSY